MLCTKHLESGFSSESQTMTSEPGITEKVYLQEWNPQCATKFMFVGILKKSFG